jgi:long-chain acyl-CoA synthetase
MNLAEQLEAVAGEQPRKVALRTDTGREITFEALDAAAAGAAGALRALGVGAGDRVAVMAGSHPEFVAAFYGIWKLGAVAVALNAQLGSDEVRYQLRNSGARVAICDPGRSREVVEAAAADGETPELEHVLGIDELRGEVVTAVALPDDALATIFYTSGTTGVPKGAAHTHRALAVQLEVLVDRYGYTSDDVFVSVMPIYLLSILLLGPITSIRVGATCRLLPRYDPWGFAQAVREDRVTVVGACVPMLFSDLVDLPPEQAEQVDLSTIRIACCGGSPMAPEVRRTFEERFDFRFIHAYGGTEGPAMVTADPLDRPRKFDSVGIALAHVRISIEDDNGNELPARDVGEICIGPREEGAFAGAYEPMACYWGMPEETEETLRGGKMRLGDVGYLDEDGFLYLVDRKKDMIIRGGMNVYPKELETLIYADPRIAECAVVAAPHRRYGEVPFAFVRAAEGAKLTESDVLAIVNDKVARFKHLSGARVLDEFPRNALGKIVKRELRAQVGEADIRTVA